MKKSRSKNGNNVIGQLTPEELLEYTNRRALHEMKLIEARSSAYYLDLIVEQFKSQYELPRFFDINLQTGKITRTEVPTDEGTAMQGMVSDG